METFKFDPNNTEGAYPDAFVAEGTEIKKGSKIVATDLVDLYDVDINPLTLADEDTLVYEEVSGKWINMAGGTGVGCNLIVTDSNRVSPYYWAEKTYNNLIAPLGINGFGYCTYSTYTYFVGGSLFSTVNSGYATDRFFRYNPLSDTWSELTPIPYNNEPVLIYPYKITMRGWTNILYVFCSFYDNGNYWIEIFSYNTITGLWNYIPNNLPEFHNLHTACTIMGNIYFYCEKVGGGENELLIFDTSTYNWSTGPSIPFIDFLGSYAIAVFNQCLYICGGLYFNENTGMNENSPFIFQFEASSNTWTIASSSNPHLASSLLSTYFNTGIVVYGGINNNGDYDTSAMWYYNVFNDTWHQELFPSSYGIFGYYTSFDTIINNYDRLILIGGYNNGFGVFNIALLQYINDSWVDSLYVDANTTVIESLRDGMFYTPFISLTECFEWLRNKCITIEDQRIVTIHVLSDLEEYNLSLNYLYGRNIIIDGGDHKFIGNFHISNNHTIKEIKNFLLEFTLYNDLGGTYYYIANYDDWAGDYYFEVYHNSDYTRRANIYFLDRFGDPMRNWRGDFVYLSEYSHPSYKDEFGNKRVFNTNTDWFYYDDNGDIQPKFEQKDIMYDPDNSYPEYDEFGELQYDEFGNILYERGSRVLYEMDFNYYDGKEFIFGQDHFNAAIFMEVQNTYFLRKIIKDIHTATIIDNSSTKFTNIKYENRYEPKAYDIYDVWVNSSLASLPLKVMTNVYGPDYDVEFFYGIYDARASFFIENQSNLYGDYYSSIFDMEINNLSALTLEQAGSTSDSNLGNIYVNNSSIVVIEKTSPMDNHIVLGDDCILIRY